MAQPGENLIRTPMSNQTMNIPMTQVRDEGCGVNAGRTFTKRNKGININDAINENQTITTTELSGYTIVRNNIKLFHLRPNNVGQGRSGYKTEEWAHQIKGMEVVFGPKIYAPN